MRGNQIVKVIPTKFNRDGTLNTQLVFAGTKGGLFLSEDGGQTWFNESLRGGSGLPRGAEIYDVAVAQGDSFLKTQAVYVAVKGFGSTAPTSPTTTSACRACRWCRADQHRHRAAAGHRQRR